MTTKLWLDTETFSVTPINCGGYRYSENVEVMLFPWAIDNEDVALWQVQTEKIPKRLDEALREESVLLYAHNSMFDRVMLRQEFPHYPLDIPRWRDTMVLAMMHSLPGSLDKLCEILGLPSDLAKIKDSRRLIQLFCKPRPKSMKLRRATAETHPQDWSAFCDYAVNDVVAMREVARRLPKWNHTESEIAVWHCDQRINDRGFAVDVALATKAVETVSRTKQKLATRAQEITEGAVEATTQRDKLLQHLVQSYGVSMPDLTKATVERRLNDPDLPDAVRELLINRQGASATNAKKYSTLLKSVSADGRIRGAHQFAGAKRTNRWAGRIFQPQNMARPDMPVSEIALGIDALLNDCADLLFDNMMRLVTNTIRGCVIAPKGKKLVIADYSNVEGRGLAWLAGEDWKVKAFSDYDKGIGHDMYKLTYSRSFGVNVKDVDGWGRQQGKVQELALGYEGGVGAFVTFATTYRVDLQQMTNAAYPTLPDDVLAEAESLWDYFKEQERSTLGLPKKTWITCDSIKRLWRRAHPATVDLWAKVENCAKAALRNPGQLYRYRGLSFQTKGAWLLIRLPSGRALCYPSPRIVDNKLSYMGEDTYTRQWTRIGTYGGKLVENITQATCRDLLAQALPKLDAAGYLTVTHAHDEAVAETPDTDQYNLETMIELMTETPPWAEGFPLSADGFETHRYRKKD